MPAGFSICAEFCLLFPTDPLFVKKEIDLNLIHGFKTYEFPTPCLGYHRIKTAAIRPTERLRHNEVLKEIRCISGRLVRGRISYMRRRSHTIVAQAHQDLFRTGSEFAEAMITSRLRLESIFSTDVKGSNQCPCCLDVPVRCV